MADKTIGELPDVDEVYDEALIPIEQLGTAHKMTGKQFRQFGERTAEAYVATAVQAAKDAATAKADAEKSAGTAMKSADAAEEAQGGAEKARAAIENIIVDAVTLASGQAATVEKTAADEAVKLLFGLPKGDTGEKGQKGDAGNGIESIQKTAGTGAPGTTDTYTIAFTDGETFAFQVYNGLDGTGAVLSVNGKKGDVALTAEDIAGLSRAALTGSYGDLTDTPTIPAAVRVKGDGEAEYRTGDVNLTPANIGALASNGTAASATKLAAGRTFSLTGDATGTSAAFDGSGNASIPVTLASSGAAAGSYGPTAAATLGYGGAVNVPQVTVDGKGRVTSIANRQITLPAAPSSVSGNAGTATKLATARTINGVAFDGSQNITVYDSTKLPTSGGTITGTTTVTGGSIRFNTDLAIYLQAATSGSYIKSFYMSTSDQIVVGYDSYATVIRGSSMELRGVYGNTTTSAANMTVNSSHAVNRYASSSGRYKHDIKPIEEGTLDPHRLYKLPVRQFVYNEDYLSKKDQRFGQAVPGFIAEEVAEHYPIAADLDEEGRPEDWGAKWILPGMLALIQEQHEAIEEMKQEIRALKGKKEGDHDGD